MEKLLKKTPLFSLHKKAKAKMVNFVGYDMPLIYKGILAEHNHTRQAASLFDVSHMGQISLHHPEGFEATAQALETIVPSSLQGMADGDMKYSVLLNEQGGIQDDVIIIRRSDHIYLIVNASQIQKDLAHLQRYLITCTIIYHEDMVLVALQGPKSAKVLQSFLPKHNLKTLFFMQSCKVSIENIPIFLMRSGYTGEDGFELAVSRRKARKLVQILMDNTQISWAGLGARDSLRLEAGLCLYGHDLSEQTSPIEAGLQWIIPKKRREKLDFLGNETIVEHLKKGPERQRVGLLLKDRLPAREGAEIVDKKDKAIGHVTSGTFSPTLNKAIAMGYVSKGTAKVGDNVSIIIRGKAQPAEIVQLPFVPPHYYKKGT